jgi:hypothetical protein
MATNKCIARTHDIRVKILENLYEILNTSRMMLRVDVWGLQGGGRETDKIHRRFKNILGSPRFVANTSSVAEL